MVLPREADVDGVFEGASASVSLWARFFIYVKLTIQPPPDVLAYFVSFLFGGDLIKCSSSHLAEILNEHECVHSVFYILEDFTVYLTS